MLGEKEKMVQLGCENKYHRPYISQKMHAPPPGRLNCWMKVARYETNSKKKKKKKRNKWKQVTQKWQAVSGSTNYVPLLMSTTNANFQDSFLSGILPVKDQEHNLCPILMSAYYWCQWKCFATWTWTILPVQPEICLPDSRIGLILTFAYLEPCKWSNFHFYWSNVS